MKRDVVGLVHRASDALRQRNRIRGDAARNAGKWLIAINAYEAHLALHEDDTAIWVQLGHAYKEAGAFQEAELAYLHALAQAPLDADIFLNIGHLQKVRGRPDLALTAYEKSALLEPGLASGAAMVERERILGRITWFGERGAAPDTLPKLLAAIETAESGEVGLFHDYYTSFKKR